MAGDTTVEARDRALRYLSARMCSAHQLKEYLKRKGHPDDEIDPLIEELKEYHYLDDLRYAAAFIESGYEKGRGISRIRRELKQKGVSQEVISSAEESIDSVPDEFEVAFSLAQKVIEKTDPDRMDRKEKEALKAKIARRLAGRGFSSDVIFRVIGRLL